MSLIATRNGGILLVSGKVAVGADCCCQDSCDCPSEVNIGGNATMLTFSVSTFGTPYTTCDLCISAAIGGVLHKSAGQCRYYGTYSLTSCTGFLCEVKVYFDLSNFPDCECNGSGDNCDYTVAAWELSAGLQSITIDDVVTGDFC